MARDERDIVGAATDSTWAVTNRTTDRSFDCNVNNTLVTSDVLGTLIEDLIAQGILKGSVA